jgi:hypothetical protein
MNDTLSDGPLDLDALKAEVRRLREEGAAQRTHSDEWCMAIERERLAQIADLEVHLQGCRTALGDCIAESDAEITRLRAVIAQLREDWRPKAQQEIAAMTAAREVARRYADEYRMHWDGMTAEDIGAFDRLVEAFKDG